MRKLLMHCCCAPCFTYIENDISLNGILNEQGIYEHVDLTACFYNPNIHPKAEYERRKDAFIQFCKIRDCKNVIIDEYNLNDFLKDVIDNVGVDKKYKSRCEYCYYMRLKKVFEYAKLNSYDMVATTLTISPYQNHYLIEKVGRILEKEYNVKYLTTDYREHFKEGQEMARNLSIYMQKYCGCLFSLESRYNSDNCIKQKNLSSKEKENIQIKKVNNKKDYIYFILKYTKVPRDFYTYLNKADMYILQNDKEVISVAIFTRNTDEIIELKNIVTNENYQNMGYAKKLLKHVCSGYSSRYSKIIVGANENNIPFFVKQGFDKFEKKEKNYFIDNYDEEIIDNNLKCVDVYYYSKDLLC